LHTISLNPVIGKKGLSVKPDIILTLAGLTEQYANTNLNLLEYVPTVTFSS